MGQDRKAATSTDLAECMVDRQLFRELAKQDLYNWAALHWKKCQKECPALWEPIYMQGVLIYEHFIESNSGDIAAKHAYLDTLFWILDERIKHFENKAHNLALKGHYLLKHRPTEVDRAQSFFEKAYELQEGEVEPFVMIGIIRCLVEKHKNADDRKQKQKLETEMLNRYAEFEKICQSNQAKFETSDAKRANRYWKCAITINDMVESIKKQ